MGPREQLQRARVALTRPLPEAGRLAEDVWARRHRMLSLFAAAQGVLLTAAAQVTATASPATYVLLAIVISLVVLGLLRPAPRGLRAGAVGMALVASTTSVMLLTDGSGTGHLHLFAMLSLVAIYQDWRPLPAAFGAAALCHFVIGYAPGALPGFAAGGQPSAWSSGHLAALVAAAFVNLLAWQLGERRDDRVEHVLDATADGMHGVDVDGRITFVNAALARMLDTSPEAMIGRHHHEALGHIEDEEGSCRLCTTVQAGRRGHGVNARLALRPRRAVPRSEASRGDVVGAHHPDGEDEHELPVECAATLLWKNRAVAGAVVTIRDMRERHRLARQALHDPLTGLANRTLLRSHLEHALAALDRHRQTTALLFCDLDGFKEVNDRLGHSAGDALLVAMANRLQTAVRGHDTVSRFGGDEFVILCTDLDSVRDVTVIAERLAETMREPIVFDGERVHVSVSIGVSVFDHPDVAVDTLLEEADLAMYRAKEQGRNRVEFYSAALREQASQRARVESELADALERGEFEIYYQPRVRLANEAVDGVEALVRWHHPSRGILTPSDFLETAEESGLMPELGGWALEQAACQVTRWREEHPSAKDLSLTVNVSLAQLRDVDTVERIAGVLEATGLPPEALCLDIAELALVDDTPTTIQTLHDLKNLGIRLAVDGFGTGWSPLSYLSRVPVDILNIDRRFISHLDAPGDNQAVVTAAMSLARSLGLEVVAHGVERDAQATALRALGYERAQGYRFHEPIPATEVTSLLEARSNALAANLSPSDHATAPPL